MYELTIKEKKHVLITHLILFFCWFFVVALELWNMHTGNDSSDLSVLLFMVVLFGGTQLFFLLKHLLWRMDLGRYGCRVRNRFGIVKEFSYKDVARIETKIRYFGVLPVEYLTLIGQDGRKIARINRFTTMERGEVIEFFEEYNQKLVIDDDGFVYMDSDLPIEEKINKSSEKEIRRRKEMEQQWRSKPAFYENPEWMKRIRTMGLRLQGIEIILIIVAFLAPIGAGAWIYGIYPLILLGYFVCFRRVLVWKYPKETTREWEATHVVMPDMTIPFLLSFFLMKISTLNFQNLGQCLSFWKNLSGIMILVFLVITFSKKGKTRILGPILSMVLYGYIGVYCWNYMLSFDEPVCEQAIILEENTAELLTVTQYQMQVEMEDGTECQVIVTGQMQTDLEPGDMLTVFRETSVFGLEYTYAMK